MANQMLNNENGVLFSCRNGEEIFVADKNILSMFDTVANKIAAENPNWQQDGAVFQATIAVNATREVVQFILDHVGVYQPPADNYVVHDARDAYPDAVEKSKEELREMLEAAQELGNDGLVQSFASATSFVIKDLPAVELVEYLGVA